MKSSWKTTITGVCTIIGGICTLIPAAINGDTVTLGASITAIIGGIGLIFAKDSDKK